MGQKSMGQKSQLAVTGMPGTGKSVLLDHLSGDALRGGYSPPERSAQVERETLHKLENFVWGDETIQSRLDSGQRNDHSQQSDAQELSDLLDVAERIQASYEASKSRASTGDFIEVVLALLALVAFTSSAVLFPRLGVPVGFLAGFVVLGYIAVFDKAIQRLRRRSETDRRALQEVLDLLREIEGMAAIEGTWSRLQRAEFRIRLSRFEIEEPRTLRESLRRRLQL